MDTDLKPDKEVDTHGEVCPFPWVHAKKAMKKLEVGQVLCVVGDHGPALENIPRNFSDDAKWSFARGPRAKLTGKSSCARTNESWKVWTRRLLP